MSEQDDLVVLDTDVYVPVTESVADGIAAYGDEHGVTARLLREYGRSGGNPEVRYIGTREAVTAFRAAHLDDEDPADLDDLCPIRPASDEDREHLASV